MLVIWIILVLMVLVLSFLLIAPIQLKVDTYQNQYELKWGNLIRCQFLISQEFFDSIFRLRFAFFGKQFPIKDLMKRKKSGHPKDIVKPKSETRSKSNQNRISLRFIYQFLKSFHIKTLQCELDTDDFVVNSYLYPLTMLINRDHRHRLLINYKGEMGLRMWIENRGYRLLGVLLKNWKSIFVT